MPSAILLVSIFRLPSRIAALIDSTFAVSMSEPFDARKSDYNVDRLTGDAVSAFTPFAGAVTAAVFASLCDARCEPSCRLARVVLLFDSIFTMSIPERVESFIGGGSRKLYPASVAQHTFGGIIARKALWGGASA